MSMTGVRPSSVSSRVDGANGSTGLRLPALLFAPITLRTLMPRTQLQIRPPAPLIIVVLSAAVPLSAQTSTAPRRLALGGPPPAIRTQTQLVRFVDELEAQQLALYEALSLELYFQWKGETHHYAGPFGRLLADLQTRRDYAAIIDRWRG